jgi:NAD(P)-dependent dehydrogenase (short-subunit alcohol dehydrogenase family)
MWEGRSLGSLRGRVALVTGAGRRRGIGRGIALELARAGADVAVHARVWEDDPWPHEELVALGRRYAVLEGDLTDPQLVRGLARSVGAELGVVDILVNNAGVAGGAGHDRLLELEDELWYRTVDVNLNAYLSAPKA